MTETSISRSRFECRNVKKSESNETQIHWPIASQWDANEKICAQLRAPNSNKKRKQL